MRSFGFWRALGVAALISLGHGTAHATLMSHSAVNGLDTFQDSTTGRVWLKLTDLFGMSYSAQVGAAVAAGFTVADYTATLQLVNGSASVGSSTAAWDAVAAIVGSSSSRALMWGNYATNAATGSPNNWFYSYRGNDWSHYDPANTTAMSDLGLFAYLSPSTAVPEPATFMLLGVGLLGMAGLRRTGTRQVGARQVG